ncbi:putative sensor histidine kinase [Hyphomonas neptunium ATCC 15444]|uniref:histidine kinase n=1 Tax=Hyphomonas neptunium (strain ATCC 15444) TaxID=228405 RepID=Q0C540_HYPNA|nr:putative sensor histidine kinase [Hyphomonas neptunium ATCC 15444]
MRSHLQLLPAFVALDGRLSRPVIAATYLVSVLVFVVALILRIWLDPYLPQGFPFLTFFPAVLISGFAFGVRQGAMVAVLSAFASWYYFIPPVGVDFSMGTLLAMGLYLFVVITELTLISLMMRAYRAESAARNETERLASLQETMAQELDHRLKNIFATMNAIISLSLRGVSSPEELASRLKERVSALGRSNLLLRGFRDGEEVALDTVIAQALEPFSIVGTARFSGVGPRVPLGGQTLVVLGLILHELGTNAAKYGALSVPTGRITLSWHMTPGLADEGEQLRIEWRETGGPVPAPPPTASRGFGSTLMSRVITSVGGQTEIDYPPEGAIVRMTLPADMLNQITPAD